MLIHELEAVVLTRDLREHGLEKGDIGTVVHAYTEGEVFEVEFATAEAKTIAILTLSSADIRAMGPGEILHARELAQAS